MCVSFCSVVVFFLLFFALSSHLVSPSLIHTYIHTYTHTYFHSFFCSPPLFLLDMFHIPLPPTDILETSLPSYPPPIPRPLITASH
jgi:hypothetical protein